MMCNDARPWRYGHDIVTHRVWLQTKHIRWELEEHEGTEFDWSGVWKDATGVEAKRNQSYVSVLFVLLF